MNNWPKLSKEEHQIVDKRAVQLLHALSVAGEGTAQMLITAYILEAVMYGKTGRWVLDEKIENDEQD